MALVLGLVLLALGGYAAVGPAGVLGRVGGEGLRLPDTRVNALGAHIVEVDEESWQEACLAADLPDFPNPSGLEIEPIRRLVEASRRWAEAGEGDELGRMGEIALALELHDTAIGYFAAARELGAARVRWTYLLGAEHQIVGEQEPALAALEEARRMEPDYGTTHVRIGALHLERGELEAADASYAEAATLPAAPASGLIGRGRVALERRDFAAALELLEAALRITPQDFLAHRLRSRALAGLERTEEAAAAAALAGELPMYRGWLSFDPRLQEVQAAAGTQRSLENALRIALSSGDMARARQAVDELLARVPKSPQMLSLAAQIHANSGGLERAQELITTAVELDPLNLDRLGSQVEIAMAARKLDVAREAARRYCDQAPGEGRGYQLLGRVLYLEGRGDEAVAELERAVALEQDEATHRLLLADVLQGLGRNAEARTVLEALLAREPENAQARQRLAALPPG